MQYPVPPVVDPADPLAEHPKWRTATIRPNHPRFRHLLLVKGMPHDAIQVVRGDASWAERLADHPNAPKLFENIGKTLFVVENRLGATSLTRTGARTLVGLIEFRAYSHPVGLKGSVGAAESMSDLIAALESEGERLRALAGDGWEVFRYPATGVQVLVDTRRPDEDLTPDDLP